MTVLEKVYGFCRKEKLFDGCTGCVLAVSGGPDSFAMLHLFLHNKGLFDFPVAVAHINHGLRDEADGEEECLHRYCEQNGVPFYAFRPDLKGTLPKGVGMETYARQVRYETFEALRRQLGFSHIATAHTADDNVETFLMRLCRGTGTEGLSGIKPLRDGVIARPMLCLYKSEILTYCEENGLAYAVDKTNFEPICNRNVFRNDVLPRLTDINPSLKDAVLRLQKSLQEDTGALDLLTDEAAKNCLHGSSLLLTALQNHPAAIRHRLYKKAFATVCDEALSYEKIAALDELLTLQTSSSVRLTDTVRAVKTYDGVEFTTATDKVTFGPFTLCEGTFDVGLYTLSVTMSDNPDVPALPYTVRPRQEGDKICLFKKSGTKTLKKLFIERKIPSSEREAVPVVADEHGVVWVGLCGKSADAPSCEKGYRLTLAKKTQSR